MSAASGAIALGGMIGVAEVSAIVVERGSGGVTRSGEVAGALVVPGANAARGVS